jgi:hypothetical protein
VLKDSDFYVTCATVIPVLFVALAVEKGPFEAVIRAWQKTRDTGRNFELTTLSATQAMLKALAKIAPTIDLGALPAQVETAGTAAGAADQSGTWRRVRAIGAEFGATVIAPFLALFAIAIVLAGTGGEGLAVYVLYQGVDSAGERQWVLIATLFMVAAVAVGPLLAYLRSLLESIFSGLKSEARTAQIYFSLLRDSISLLESALKQKSHDTETPGAGDGNGL